MVTHRTREDLLGDNGGTFAFAGLEAAARRAEDAAGDKDVRVPGAEVARQLPRAGLLDDVYIHLVPLLMGDGTRLFAGERAELVPAGKPVAGTVPHLRYRLPRRRRSALAGARGIRGETNSSNDPAHPPPSLPRRPEWLPPPRGQAPADRRPPSAEDS